MNYPKGLISYTTERSLDEGTPRPRLLRPRVLVYATVLIAAMAALITSVATRVPVELDIIRDRHALYRTTPIGLIENVYTLKIINMDNRRHDYTLEVFGIEGITLIGEANFSVEANGNLTHIVNARVDPAYLKRTSNSIYFDLKSTTNPKVNQSEEARFLGPSRR